MPPAMDPRPRSSTERISRSEFCGRQVVWVGMIGASGGLLLGLFLRTIVARTPTQLPSYALFWLVLLLAVVGCLGAMAIEVVRQLQASSPDPAYHHLRQQRLRQAAERRQRRRRQD